MRQQYKDILSDNVRLEHPPGWAPLVERFFDEALRQSRLHGFTIEVVQTKEKLARLEIYYTLQEATDEQRHELNRHNMQVAKEAQHICQFCGDEGQLVYDEDMWRYIACEQHTPYNGETP